MRSAVFQMFYNRPARIDVMDSDMPIEILRQRITIDHDDGDQSRITEEYTIRALESDLDGIALISNKFLPNLQVRNNHNAILSLVPSKELELLYMQHLEENGLDKQSVQKRLDIIKTGKRYLIWFILDRPMNYGEIRTFTLTYMPQIQNPKSRDIFMRIKQKEYPVYYILSSPEGFQMNIKFMTVQDRRMVTRAHPPDNVRMNRLHSSLMLRVDEGSEDDFGFMYSFRAAPTLTRLTRFGGLLLLVMPLVYFTAAYLDLIGLEAFLERNIEVGLFVTGASLLLPTFQRDAGVRNSLMGWYMIPAVLGILMMFA